MDTLAILVFDALTPSVVQNIPDTSEQFSQTPPPWTKLPSIQGMANVTLVSSCVNECGSLQQETDTTRIRMQTPS